jgi:hypothetical protein
MNFALELAREMDRRFQSGNAIAIEKATVPTFEWKLLYAAIETDTASLADALTRIDAMQAKIDALMLEFCPEDMTPEQIAEWGAHQRPVSEVDATFDLSFAARDLPPADLAELAGSRHIPT